MTQSTASLAFSAADVVHSKKKNFTPSLGIILGSGLASLGDRITEATAIPYSELPGFPVSTVSGHPGKLILGKLNGLPVACLQGRAHWYEGVTSQAMQTLIHTLKVIGCDSLMITNAAGSLRQEVGPGQLMLITDHINFQGRNPLVGANEDKLGPRFVPMGDTYDLHYRKRLLELSNELHIPLAQGVLMAVLGPSFETPAEIRAFRILGADAICMSSVPDAIIARHCGLRVALMSAITNFASGMSDETITHEGTLHYAKLAAENMSRLIETFAKSLHEAPC